jgi:hypothetical protein
MYVVRFESPNPGVLIWIQELRKGNLSGDDSATVVHHAPHS